jgi:hypothetical protein
VEKGKESNKSEICVCVFFVFCSKRQKEECGKKETITRGEERKKSRERYSYVRCLSIIKPRLRAGSYW